MTSPHGPVHDAGYRDVDPVSGSSAARSWWDENAAEYLDEHGEFLGDNDLCWCPEGLRESDACLLGPVAGRSVLEIGAGAGQGSRWVRDHGGHAIATDISHGMLASGRARDTSGAPVAMVQADAMALPFGDASFDIVFTAYGALPFLADDNRVHAEVARVLRDGGRWVFSVTHPVRWAFPDVATAAGLTVSKSYFDRRPYVETDEAGTVVYAEYHRTIGDHISAVVGAGLTVRTLVEPEWPAGHHAVWGGWGPERASLPGTLIVVADRPAR